MPKRKEKSRGRFEMFIGQITVSRGGKVVIDKSVEVRRELIDGQWITTRDTRNHLQDPLTPASLKRKVRKPNA